MPTMSRYCKAYPLDALRQYPGWHELSLPERGTKEDTERDTESTKDVVRYVFLHDSYIVTWDMFADNKIFDNITPDWIDFCKTTLSFEPPVEEGDHDPTAAVSITAGH